MKRVVFQKRLNSYEVITYNRNNKIIGLSIFGSKKLALEKYYSMLNFVSIYNH